MFEGWGIQEEAEEARRRKMHAILVRRLKQQENENRLVYREGHGMVVRLARRSPISILAGRIAQEIACKNSGREPL